MKRYFSHLWYAVQTFFLRRKAPYLFVLALNDRCNLDCFYCTCENKGSHDLDRGEALEMLRAAYARGHRVLVITGGEPTIWSSEKATLADIVMAARRIGFVEVMVFTNGTRPLPAVPCRYMISIDGTRERHNSIRPGTYDLILEHIRSARVSVVAAVTISRANVNELEETVRSIAAAGVFAGISFHLFTGPLATVEKFGFNAEERRAVLARIWALKRSGYPVMLSRAACRAMQRNDWKRPIQQVELGTKDKIFTCCRDVVRPEVCRNCGYTGCIEIAQALAGRPSAIWELLRHA